MPSLSSASPPPNHRAHYRLASVRAGAPNSPAVVARRTDATLEALRRYFDAPDDCASENGQPFLFRPRPPRPPIFVGGAPPHAAGGVGGAPGSAAVVLREIELRSCPASCAHSPSHTIPAPRHCTRLSPPPRSPQSEQSVPKGQLIGGRN